jgi:cold shock CspA family protein/ribosome-associated translation inhibitor RaiA
MQVPPEVSFRNIEPTEELKARIHQEIDGLEEVYDRITTVRVMVEETNRPGRRAGKFNHVRIDITIPRHEIVINRSPSARPGSNTLPQAISEAFDKARRQLVEHKRIQRGEVKTPGLPTHGRVIRLLNDAITGRFGFIEDFGGREIYFHENAVVGMTYDDLDVGMEVRYAEEEGKEGPQASNVAPIDTAEIGPKREEEIPLKTQR